MRTRSRFPAPGGTLHSPSLVSALAWHPTSQSSPPGTERRIGGVNPHFGVTYPLNQDARPYAAAILFSFIEAAALARLADELSVR